MRNPELFLPVFLESRNTDFPGPGPDVRMVTPSDHSTYTNSMNNVYAAISQERIAWQRTFWGCIRKIRASEVEMDFEVAALKDTQSAVYYRIDIVTVPVSHPQMECLEV